MKIYRGPRNMREFENIMTFHTAGGVAPNTKPVAPTDEELANYERTTKGTAGECMPPKPEQDIVTEFTEYTTDENVGKGFGRRCGYYVCAEVEDDLVKIFPNDCLEKGVLVRSDTPIECTKVRV